nr:DUF5694 domain-containing protein [Thalassobacillus sp. CUG 92003]
MRHTPDLNRVDARDLLEAHRKEEIRNVIDHVKCYQPTKIAVEVIKREHEELNKAYQRYLNNTINLEINEVHQIGFKLAEEMGHTEIYAVDWMETVGNLGIGQVLEWAKEHQPALYHHIRDTYLLQQMNGIQDRSIYDYIRLLNDEEQVKKDHEQYMAIAKIGEGTAYIGIDWVRWWYQRNLIIYSNLARITHSPHDRTLTVVGAGHVHLLTQFLKESGDFDVIPAHHYLT